MIDRRLWPIIALLALSAAIWEIDPRWIIDNVGGLTPLQQGEVNQRNLGGSQLIAPFGALAALGLWLVTRRLRDDGSTAGVDWFGLWLAWALVGAVLGPDPLLALTFTGSAAVVVVATRRLTRLDPTATALAMSLAFCGYVAISLAVKATGLADLRLRSGRFTLLSLEANQFSRMATLAALAGLYLLAESKWRPAQLLGALTFLGGLGGLVLTGSRTGFAATVVALAVLIGLRRSRRVIAGVLGLGVVATLLIGLTSMGSEGLSRLTGGSSTTAGSVATLTGRTNVWPVVIDVIRQNPLAGFGLGTDTQLLSPQSYRVGFVAEHAHSLALHITLTTGLIGLGLFAAALVSALRRVSPTERPLVLALLSYVVVAGVSEAILRNPDIALVGLTFALTLAERDHRAEPHLRRPRRSTLRQQTDDRPRPSVSV